MSIKIYISKGREEIYNDKFSKENALQEKEARGLESGRSQLKF